MPIYTLQGPDGKTYKIEGPEGATAEQLAAVIQGGGKTREQRIAEQMEADRKLYDPTSGMSGTDKFLAGVGKAMTDLGRGTGQLLGLVDREDVAESRKLDQALMNTGAGAAGNFAGNVAMLAPTAMIPGANTVAGAGVIGAAAGLAQPSTSTRETLTNIALGGAGGAGGQYVANKLPGAVRAWQQRGAQEVADQTAQTAQKFAAAQKGNQLGYVVPPADLNPGMTSELLSGLSGKIKTAQVASQRNQAVTDKLARQALGLADDAQLTPDVLQGLRNQAATSGYGPIRQAGQVVADADYLKALDSIAGQYQGAARSFPGAAKNPVVEMVDGLRQGAFDAGDGLDMVKVLRESADKAYRSGDTGLGKASKAAAEAIEEQIDRSLTAAGNKEAITAFREARKQIAKTYSVQKALNSETGSVSAQKLAQELSKGKPLSSELRDVAEFATAFPKASQALKEAPKAVSPLDWAVGMGTTVGTGNPLSLAMLGARPAARNMLLSSMVQKAALEPGFKQSAMSRLAPEVIDNQLFRLLAAPVGVNSLLATQGQ
jgi:hypothetical protein